MQYHHTHRGILSPQIKDVIVQLTPQPTPRVGEGSGAIPTGTLRQKDHGSSA